MVKSCKKGLIRVRIEDYDFYEGRERVRNRKITKARFNEIKSWQKSHPEFSNAYSMKKLGSCSYKIKSRGYIL